MPESSIKHILFRPTSARRQLISFAAIPGGGGLRTLSSQPAMETKRKNNYLYLTELNDPVPCRQVLVHALFKLRSFCLKPASKHTTSLREQLLLEQASSLQATIHIIRRGRSTRRTLRGCSVVEALPGGGGLRTLSSQPAMEHKRKNNYLYLSGLNDQKSLAYARCRLESTTSCFECIQDHALFARSQHQDILLHHKGNSYEALRHSAIPHFLLNCDLKVHRRRRIEQ